MLAQNVTLSNKQEGKIQIWNKILILISGNRPLGTGPRLALIQFVICIYLSMHCLE